MVKKPVTAIVLTSILFAASHIPIYVLAASGEGFTNLLKRGFTDTFRYLHGDVKGVYVYSSCLGLAVFLRVF